jgi:RHS repeat-associated protein
MENENEWTGKTGSHLDFGTRIYDSRIGKFLSSDPLERKYPMLTPYQYVNNNPILFIDGRKILIYYDSGEKDSDGNAIIKSHEYGSKQKVLDNEFVRTTINTIDKLRENDDINMLDEIIRNKKVVGLEKTYKYTRYSNFDGIIRWDPETAVMAQGDYSIVRISTAVALYHEFGHGAFDIIKKHLRSEIKEARKEFNKLDEDEQKDYGGFEEYFVITKLEAVINKKFKQKRTRIKHGGYPYKTDDTFSTEKIGEFTKEEDEKNESKPEIVK